ncbi:MAG: hypothetical protein C0624_08850 [Desulfuromonas sp.]|nr:MAG: hypothetical protein C0624_08850 [Desulfuromonas sp.]
MEIVLVLLILTAAIVLFATEWLRMDLVALLVLLALAITGLVTTEQAFAGFSNPAVVTVAAMFVLSAGISHTGAMGHIGERMVAFAGNSESRLLLISMLVASLFSAFINNIGATAVLMPVLMSVARRLRISASQLLMPLAFASLLGGVCTLIGTPPNILMNTLLYEYTGESFSMFSYTPVGLVIVATGIGYMLLLGRRLIPERKSGALTEAYQVKEYITEVAVLEGSPLAGKTIAKCAFEQNFGLKVRAILRERHKIPMPRRNRVIREKDTLFLEGDPAGILKIRAVKGLEVLPEKDNPVDKLADESMVVVEASLTPTSTMAGKTLRSVRFRDIFGISVLAIWRQGAPVVKKVDHVVLRFGDVLLLQGSEERIIQLGRDQGFLLLGGVPAVDYRPRQAPLAVTILLLVIGNSALGLIPIFLSAPLGAVAMILTRCLSLKDAYDNIDWPILMLIAGTLPLGLALENSGAALMIAKWLTSVVGDFGPWMVLAMVVLITALLTEFMSHAAAAVLVAPIAYELAQSMAVSPKPFFMAVALSASSCFMTPISHQSNALVMGPGGYHFFDYTRVGAPLGLLVWCVIILLVPVIFPF